jgi:multicomponent Na+:H+ antiporter subunit B
MMDKEGSSEILEDILLFIYPLIILFGIYVTLAGNIKPGGGFQGGAVLVAVFMSRYLVYPGIMKGLDFIKHLDKLILIFILTVASMFLLVLFKEDILWLKAVYNNIMGLLIGIKVCCGLSVVFYTFADIEGGHDD